MKRIEFGELRIGEKARANLMDVCDTNWASGGPKVKELETKWSSLFDYEKSVAMSSGTDGCINACLSLYDLKDAKRNVSEVIVPALSFIATSNSVRAAGLVPRFVDVKRETLNIDETKIEEAINENTVAIQVVHTMGRMAEMDVICEIAERHGLIVIEDSADTLGATYKSQPSGHYSDMSITSFYGSHIINCAGNGGALMINDDKVMEEAKLLRSWGRSSSLFDDKSEAIENRFNIDLDGIEYDAKFVFSRVGYNLEGNELGAAFGLTQLKKLSENIKVRQLNFKRQIEFFNKYPQFFINPEETEYSNTAWLAFPIQLKEKIPFSRKEFMIFLEKRNIQTRVVFTGNINRQPGFVNISKVINKEGYEVADYVMRNGILLPLHHGMTEEMFDKLHSTIELFLEKYIS